jgi:Ca2+-binding EF-hand superfamily protein
MNPFRESLVRRAFRTLDLNNDGAIDMEEIMNKYNFDNHPEVK